MKAPTQEQITFVFEFLRGSQVLGPRSRRTDDLDFRMLETMARPQGRGKIYYYCSVRLAEPRGEAAMLACTTRSDQDNLGGHVAIIYSSKMPSLGRFLLPRPLRNRAEIRWLS